jgi:exosortase F-associated protein
MKLHKVLQIVTAVISCTALVAIFLFQQFDVAMHLGISERFMAFAVNKSIRFILNDLFAIGLIFGLFGNRQFVSFAFLVQLAGMIVFLVPYLIIKYHLPSYNGPLINFLHRIIINPVFMLLLIPAFYYQLLQHNTFKKNHD